MRRYGQTTTVAELRRVDRDGNDETYEDCVTQLSCREKGIFQIDLQSVRPMRLNDRDCLVIELDTATVMQCIADSVKEQVKD